MKAAVVGIRVPIMLPHDPRGITGRREQRPDVIVVNEEKKWLSRVPELIILVSIRLIWSFKKWTSPPITGAAAPHVSRIHSGKVGIIGNM
jgi:hypothetical protein